MEIYLVIISSLLCGTWPLVTKLSGLEKGWATIFLSAGMLISAIVITACGSTNNTISQKALMLGLAAGLMNGIGLAAFNKLLTMSDVSRSATAMYALLPAVIVVSGIMFLSEPITFRKAAGLGAAVVAAILLV